jgi:hypothetical protein
MTCPKCDDTGKFITGPTLDYCWEEYCDCDKGKERRVKEDEEFEDEWWDKNERFF